MPPPMMRGAAMSVDQLATGYFASGHAKEVARRAGREVEAFDVVLLSPETPDGRSISLEIGDHGVSLRDPAGALLKVIALEHLTGWAAKADGTFVMIMSTDLEHFSKMSFRVDDGAAIDAAIKRVASERAEAILADEGDGGLGARPRSSSLSRRRSSHTKYSGVHEIEPMVDAGSQGPSPCYTHSRFSDQGTSRARVDPLQ